MINTQYLNHELHKKKERKAIVSHVQRKKNEILRKYIINLVYINKSIMYVYEYISIYIK